MTQLSWRHQQNGNTTCQRLTVVFRRAVPIGIAKFVLRYVSLEKQVFVFLEFIFRQFLQISVIFRELGFRISYGLG